MRIVLSFREELKDALSEEQYEFIARKTDEIGPVFSFLKTITRNPKIANYIKEIPIEKFRAMVVEMNELWLAGFFGDRQEEMGKILKRYLAPR